MARKAIESDFRSSKMAAGGHFVKNSTHKVAYWSGMVRNAIKSDFRSSKMAAGGHFVTKIQIKCKLCIDLKWREMRSKVIFGHLKWPAAAILWKKWKLCIDLKWRKIPSKVIFGHTKWPRQPICENNFKNMKVAYWSEMARNAIESDFRSSKMAPDGHFVKYSSKNKVACWSEMGEMWLKVIFGHPNFVKKIKQVAYWSKMAINAIERRIDLKWRESHTCK